MLSAGDATWSPSSSMLCRFESYQTVLSTQHSDTRGCWFCVIGVVVGRDSLQFVVFCFCTFDNGDRLRKRERENTERCRISFCLSVCVCARLSPFSLDGRYRMAVEPAETGSTRRSGELGEVEGGDELSREGADDMSPQLERGGGGVGRTSMQTPPFASTRTIHKRRSAIPYNLNGSQPTKRT